MHRRDFMKASLVVAGAAVASKALASSGLLGDSVAHAATPAQPADMPVITMNNGLQIPQFGFGTWTLAENTTPSVRAALESGYRLIDTAQAYQNEKEVWQGIKESGIPRKDFFITTKISPPNMRKPRKKIPSIKALKRSVESILTCSCCTGPYSPIFRKHGKLCRDTSGKA